MVTFIHWRVLGVYVIFQVVTVFAVKFAIWTGNVGEAGWLLIILVNLSGVMSYKELQGSGKRMESRMGSKV